MATHRFDPNFTDNVIDAMGPKTNPRFRKVMASLIRHVHDFARENELTVDEWMAGVKLLNWAGQMSDDKRNEGQLVCDVIGLESYVSHIPILQFPIPVLTVSLAVRIQARRRNHLQAR